jgi:large subunit ribosomal protein L33
VAKKGNRVMVELESTEDTGARYFTEKNKRNNPSRIEMKKYDPIIRKHVLFKEKK